MFCLLLLLLEDKFFVWYLCFLEWSVQISIHTDYYHFESVIAINGVVVGINVLNDIINICARCNKYNKCLNISHKMQQHKVASLLNSMANSKNIRGGSKHVVLYVIYMWYIPSRATGLHFFFLCRNWNTVLRFCEYSVTLTKYRGYGFTSVVDFHLLIIFV